MKVAERNRVLEWWNYKLDSLQRELLAEMVFGEGRNQTSLTGTEIETIYNKYN